MKNLIYLLSISFILLTEGFSQSDFYSYYSQNKFGFTSPGAMKYGLYGYDNPAVLSFVENPDVLFTWSDQFGKWHEINHWGLFAAVPNFGFGLVNYRTAGKAITDYKLTAAFGNPEFSFGIGYGWSTGDINYFDRSDLFTAGVIYRPLKYFSLGFVGNFPTLGDSEGAVELGIRPFGNELITLFGDYVYRKNRNSGDAKWSAGAAVELLDGIRLTGRYFDTKYFNAGIQISFGSFGLATQSRFDDKNKHSFNIYGIRAGAFDRNIFYGLSSRKKYVDINLLGQLKYQKFRFFDNSSTLSNLLKQIDAAKQDKTVAGIAINTSGMAINKEMLWELREKLSEFKSAGKKIVIYIDRPNIDGYHLASIADKIVMDPQGMIILEGFLLGRTYFTGTLEKLGVGFSEWRYFKYKSAMETFSQTKMTEADREQRQKLVDDYYRLAKTDICSGRNIKPEEFDKLIDEVAIFLPEDAVKYKLVDTLGRWDIVKDLVKEFEGEEKSFVKAASLAKVKLPEDSHWGKKPEVAVIYALGACAMDEGITARKLVKDVEAAVKNKNIKAIVLRVDSPGGDGLASDLIAEALKKAKGIKPVIVSQGYVAASGGYWLSMYADTIVAAPNTITGSIGVIGGWYYNKELKEKFGITTDFVKRGDHADLGFGFTFPFIGVSLPDRDLTTDEHKKMEHSIKSLYNEFVNKVAYGRNVSYDAIEPIAQGRVWSGYDGFENGLVDKLGGLSDAINIAVEKAGLKGKEYNIVEYPTPSLIDFNMFMPKLFGIEYQKDELIEHLKFRLQNNGRIMPILPLEDMEML
jgi:protease-4